MAFPSRVTPLYTFRPVIPPALQLVHCSVKGTGWSCYYSEYVPPNYGEHADLFVPFLICLENDSYCVGWGVKLKPTPTHAIRSIPPSLSSSAISSYSPFHSFAVHFVIFHSLRVILSVHASFLLPAYPCSCHIWLVHNLCCLLMQQPKPLNFVRYFLDR